MGQAAQKRVNFLVQKMKDADVARDELAAQRKSLIQRQAEAKAAVQKARETADRFKPAYVKAMNKYWVRAKQAKLIEKAQAVDKNAFTVKSSDLGVEYTYAKAKKAKEPWSEAEKM